jgi:hypothetical protein
MIVYILIILLILYIINSISKESKEGFENKNLDNDVFYSKLYDNIWNMIPFYKTQIELMKPYFNTITDYNNVLCIDCKTGHMPQLLSNIKVTGLDNSKHMIDISKQKYSSISFVQGEDPSIFKENLFTHIYCPLFSINTKDIDLFFECIDKWLVPKGYLFIVSYERLNISKFLVPNSKVQYDIEISNDKLTEKISYSNQTKKNIYYLKPQMFEYYKLINKIEIPNYSCYLNVYQK